jgi:hypothetical protein
MSDSDEFNREYVSTEDVLEEYLDADGKGTGRFWQKYAKGYAIPLDEAERQGLVKKDKKGAEDKVREPEGDKGGVEVKRPSRARKTAATKE